MYIYIYIYPMYMYIHTYLCVSVEDHEPGTESPALFSEPGQPKSCPEEMAMATCLGCNSSWDDKTQDA